MKTKHIILIFTIFNSLNALATPSTSSQHAVPIDIQNAGPDLPPVGSSLFDKIFYQKNSRKYEVPFPLANMVDKIADLSGSESIVHGYFPFSRSLQRPVDLSYSPLESPRTVFGVGPSDNPMLSNRLYWAYVRAKDQMEVISYNEEAGRFEFQILRDYSTNPQIFYAQRAKCLACHQNQAPILSIAPWNDSGSFKNGTMRKALLSAHSIDNGPDITPNPNLDYKLVGETDNTREDLVELDRRIRDGDGLANFQRLYVYGCTDRQCRLQLLMQIFNLCNFVEQTDPSLCSEDLRYSPLKSNLRDAKWASSELSEVVSYQDDALVKLSYDVIEGPVSPFDRAKLAAPYLFSSPDAMLQIIESLKTLPAISNPASSRLTGTRGFLGSFTIASSEANLFNIIRGTRTNYIYDDIMESVQTALLSLYEKGSPIFDARPFNQKEFVNLIRKELNYGEDLHFNLPSLNAREYARVLREPLPPIFSEPVLNLFINRCGSCHQSGEPYPNPFLSGNEEQVKHQIGSIKDLITRRITRSEMPPTRELQRDFQNSPDYDAILDYLGAD
ncbi:MAG: hypothetical protein R2827_05420 [Bdellovibrionales bacterium]